MLNLQYLKEKLVGQLDGISADDIIESAAGYDGIVSLIQMKGMETAIVLEHNEVGEFSFRPGGFQRASQSIWVMRMVGADTDRRSVQDEALALMKRILSVFVHYEHDAELGNWEWNSVPYGIRNAGPNYTGYEFTMSFNEDVNLSYTDNSVNNGGQSENSESQAVG